MSKDFHELLKDSGYLDTPANRFFWKNASPTFRSHLRQWFILSLSTALPFAGLLASLSQLEGWDRFTLFLFYTMFYCAGFALLDLAAGFFVRLARGLRRDNPILNWTPIPLAMLFLFIWENGLENAIDLRTMETRILIWSALALSCWIAGKSCQLLFISRLYWHGIRPPKLRKYPLLTALVLAGMILLHFRTGGAEQLPDLEPQKGSPMIVLAFDVPHERFNAYTDLFPKWSFQDFQIQESDVTNFWTELGTGTDGSLHQTSLVVFKTPFFARPLNSKDPTQSVPLFFMKKLGLTSPVSEGGRFRQYFWEILDHYQLKTHTYAWWHSFPASSGNGGVLSERWTPDQTGHPYDVGLTVLEPRHQLPFTGNATLEPSIHRENQAWAQLAQRVNQANFHLASAYFPLADLVIPDQQSPLIQFRRESLDRILTALPRDTRISVVLSSGKPRENEAAPILHHRIISNWLHSEASPLESHLDLAATILHAYGLPPDLLMAPSRMKFPLDIPVERVDYGEPEQDRTPDPRSDENYYEELRSLGYVQ